MNPFRSNVGTLNEILFEGKNKSYGAYAIRKAYESTLLKSLGITASIMLGTVWTLSVILGKEVEVVIPDTADPLTKVITMELDHPKDPNNDKPKAKEEVKSAAAALKNNSNHYVIKDKPADSLAAKIIDPVLPTGTGSVTNTSTLVSDPGPNTNTTITGGGGNSTEPFNYYEDAPEFPGGLKKFWNENLKYPNEAREMNIEGRVFINFVLDEEGKIMSCKVIKKLGYGCDDEVLRVVKLMPKWKPGRINGKAVKVTFNQVVDFRLK